MKMEAVCSVLKIEVLSLVASNGKQEKGKKAYVNVLYSSFVACSGAIYQFFIVFSYFVFPCISFKIRSAITTFLKLSFMRE